MLNRARDAIAELHAHVNFGILSPTIPNDVGVRRVGPIMGFSLGYDFLPWTEVQCILRRFFDIAEIARGSSFRATAKVRVALELVTFEILTELLSDRRDRLASHYQRVDNCFNGIKRGDM